MNTKTEQPGPEVLDNFVVLEGLDGSGTTTQLHLARSRLEKLGVPHFCTGEPTDGAVGTTIRAILRKQIAAQPGTVALLFAADRSEHLWDESKGMVARLRRGELVLCDRYLFSSLAYQSLSCDFEFVYSLNRLFPLPRHLVFLDTPVELSQQRLVNRCGPGRELYEDLEIQQAIVAGYERGFALYKDEAMRLHRLDGRANPDLVFEKFWNILESLPILKS